ncbi:glycosyltransferase family 4 protein [Myriangium duriaei CBS 260.36]|uniref:Glycosyltransferase family 4 protein n=1 Tax=Myriangium duriaei CBS 260.36 TaxID=1168546 RepID=A0A9P4JA39_9PEZI|nr:glycosyltransferase family 4 protein [Myriangium duriaei CBS 260.36]
MADDLRDTCLYQGFDGLVLLFDDTYKAVVVNDFLARLREHGIPVIFMAESDAYLLDSLHFGLLDGVILQNAHVLRNGKRRDFFRAARLRDQIARIKRQQNTRPEFFFGFLELWNQQPSASVLRRAYKLADFFGAVIEARPASVDVPGRLKKEMPLSGFDYLKKMDVVWCQKQWSQEASFDFTQTKDADHVVGLDASKINDIIPSADRLLASRPLPVDLWSGSDRGSLEVSALDYSRMAPRLSDFWNTSSCGANLCPLGSFNLREEVVREQYDEILKTQRHLKELNMLHQLSVVELSASLDALAKISQLTSHPVILQDLREGLKLGNIRVFKGLDSGFNLPDNGGHFWGLTDEVQKDGCTMVDIYLSLKNADDAATIWHVFLAYHGIPRSIRYLEELHFVHGKANEYGVTVPKSILKELEGSTESEMLYLLQQIRLSALRHPIADGIKTICTKLLIEKATRTTWSDVHSKACLDGSIRLKDLFQMRLDFLKEKGAQSLPDVDNLMTFYNLLDSKVGTCLFECNRAVLNRLLGVMLQTYSTADGRAVDVTTDLYSLIFFCVLRKYAFEDVYLETTDRCPLFLSQHDQAGVFAELWVLGSQCQIYFGILPRALGEVIYDRYRDYLEENPPPLSSWNGTDVFTAYSNTKELPGDVPGTKLNEPDKDKKKEDDIYHKLGALSIFCLPALMDVLLLTFLGRGFYLTAFMNTQNNQDITQMANYAILIALLMTGGITGWVGSTGGFYLFNYAFENMTHFFVQRMAAAFLLTTVVAIGGFIGFSLQTHNWFNGFVFVLYLYALSTFLNLLGVLATMHRPGSPLTSGRIVMWKCIPILFISPILTTFVNGHDLLIYMLVVYTFNVVLIVRFRNLCHEWTSWQVKVPTIKEKDLVAWFKEKVADPDDEDFEQDDNLLAAEARDLLKAEVHRYHNRSLYMKIFYTVSDQFVKKMAVGHPYAMWLLEKEAYGADLPETYTPTWFVQLELALGNQRQLVRGLREHSQFITFRYSKYDLGQNVGLFLGALMDRWVQLVTTAQSAQPKYSNRRYALCFALVYFLVGAVAVDTVLQKYWPELAKLSDVKMSDMADFESVRQSQAALRRKHYKNAVLELFTFLGIILGAATLLVWMTVPEGEGVLLFYAYILGYTCALLFQFNRCFTKSSSAHVVTVFVCCAVGFVVGVILRALQKSATWEYDYVVALNVTTVSAAFITFLLTGYFSRPKPLVKAESAAGDRKSAADQKVLQLRSAPPSRGSSAGAHLEHPGNPCDDTHKAVRDILRNLTLDIDVNVKWTTLPEDVRRFIVSRILGTPVQLSWTVRTWLVDEGKNIARFNHGVGVAIDDLRRSATTKRERTANLPSSDSMISLPEGEPELSAALPRTKVGPNILITVGAIVIRSCYDITKWVATISGAASDVPKELWYSLRTNPLRVPLLWILLKIWKFCWLFKNLLIRAFLIAGKKPYGKFIDLMNRGNARTLDGHRIVVESVASTSTGFISRTNVSNLVVTIYDGDLTIEPVAKKPVARAFYGSTHRLHGREEANGAISTYYYDATTLSRWPSSKITVENKMEHRSLYDKYGRIKSGRIFRGQNEFSFEYVFSKRPKGNSEVLQANYSSVTNALPMTVSVFWSVKPRAGSDNVKNWTPSEKVQRVILTVDGETFDVRWIYKHAQGPELETTAMGKNGSETFTGAPEQILNDEYGFLKKPKNVHFEDEDLLIHHPDDWLERVRRPYMGSARSWSSKSSNRLVKQMPSSWSKTDVKVVYRKMTTAQLRTKLWKSWAKPPFLDAVTACLLDEMILRNEPLLKKYWHLRDAGHLLQATHALDENLEQIISAIEPTVEASQTCPLYIKSSDLFEMGLAKDSTRLTARPEDTYRDTATSTSVIFSDNGCWPDNPGGVSNCRRDLVNGHTTIRGHCLAEGANDYGVPRYQIERNINSLKVLPLWGLDGKTPYHGLLDNLLQTQIDERINMTSEDQDVKRIFIPLLKSFVRGARSRRYNREDLVTYSNVILKMNRYFETRDFNKTWTSTSVWEAWIEAWLFDYNDPNVLNVKDMMEIETPSMNNFRDALNLYICYFFIYSVEIPADCPKVFQTTHHGISSLYGILLKYRRGTTWGIWDHAILWREMCLNISPAQCLLPVPVQGMLLAGVKLACHLAYTHADIILPCTSVFNPDWEQDLGTDQGLRGSKKLFARKIDPIVNGIGNMDAFQPVKETRTKFPTTVMLSNVQFIKDVKNAVLAADVIINKFGFQDYRLTVYGAQDRQPSYALETTTLINTRGMSGKVTLAGFGSPKEVLKDAWLFMNSSLSEGLPLAIGEAALSGIPIVATEVGATALVLTDPDDPTKRYGEVVPPNDPEALARAQITLLAMLGPWTAYTHDDTPPPPLPDTFTPNDVEWITKRMYEKQEDRKALGLKLREVVLRSFHGKRYLREHEQMYWIQRKQTETRRAGRIGRLHPPVNATFGEENLYSYDVHAENEQEIRPRWQDFNVQKLRKKRSKTFKNKEYVELGEKV